ncbi:RNA polymerase, sigma subunit, ECF family [Agreia bicolorata]|uniref:RNA polymerase, sigma subunit, ECF family n=2 Tax=Agreia bicolorata TaxID=110935 RepID=A0A1T4WWK8_9MICO|nr:RNA polymerase, sigma subunit, ECF family [Agreia bicolorata]
MRRLLLDAGHRSRCGTVPVMNRAADVRLVADAARGDERAFAALYDRHVEPIYLQALSELGNEDDAQEVTQEVFAITWRKLSSVRLVDGSALPWMLVTCTNVTANRLRSQHRRPVAGSVSEEHPMANDTDRVDERFDSHRLMGRLEDEVMGMAELDQAVYRAVIHEERSYEATAVQLGISVASVRKRLNRVRTRLRHKFGGEL